MELEFHQIAMKYDGLRIEMPGFQTRLVASLRRKRRLAIAGFVAGGHAALDAIEAADHDVLGADVTPRPHRLGVRLVESLVQAPMGTADR